MNTRMYVLVRTIIFKRQEQAQTAAEGTGILQKKNGYVTHTHARYVYVMIDSRAKNQRHAPSVTCVRYYSAWTGKGKPRGEEGRENLP